MLNPKFWVNTQYLVLRFVFVIRTFYTKFRTAMNFVADGAFCWCWASVPCLDFFFPPKGRDKYLNLKVRGFLSWKLNESDL